MNPENQNPIPNTPQPTQPLVPEILPTAESTETPPFSNSTIPPVNPVPPIPPEPPKPKSKLIPVLVVVLILVALGAMGVWAYQNYFTNQPVSQSTIQPSATPIATPDPTANWKIYTNTKYFYSFRHPSNFTAGQNGMNSSTPEIIANIIVSDLSSKTLVDDPAFTVSVMPKTADTLQESAQKHFDKLLNFSPPANPNPPFPIEKNQVVINFAKTVFITKEAYTFTLKGSFYDDGASEGMTKSRERKYIWVENGDNFFLIRVDNDSIREQILSTFKFLEAVTTPTPATTTNLLPTTSWQKAENSIFSIKYPTDKFTVTSTDKFIQLTRVGQSNPGPDFLLSTGNSKSVQDWYLNYYSYSASEIGTNIFFKQKKLGSFNALEVSTKANPNYIQNIVITNGNTVVDLLTQDTDLNLVETLISTLIFK